MFRKCAARTYYALLLTLSLSLWGCSGQEEPIETTEPAQDIEPVLVFETDSTEWWVCLVCEHKVYADAVLVAVPEPYVLPSRDDAKVLKDCYYPHTERFVTCDGYTFAMPGASVSKAGVKTKYSVLGLYKRVAVIDVRY